MAGVEEHIKQGLHCGGVVHKPEARPQAATGLISNRATLNTVVAILRNKCTFPLSLHSLKVQESLIRCYGPAKLNAKHGLMVYGKPVCLPVAVQASQRC